MVYNYYIIIYKYLQPKGRTKDFKIGRKQIEILSIEAKHSEKKCPLLESLKAPVVYKECNCTINYITEK